MTRSRLRPPTTAPLARPSYEARALCGHVELAIAEAFLIPQRPLKVSQLLCAVLAQIEGEDVTFDTVQALSSGTREWLLQKMALKFWPDLSWFEGECPHCQNRFDLNLPLQTAPLSAAGPDFPVCEVETSLGTRQFEAPNGYHERALLQALGQDPLADPRRILAALLSLHESHKSDATALTAADLEHIDDALDEMCPQVADWLETPCPNCNETLPLRFDPLTFGFPKETALLGDVHILAGAYGWREREVLDLPRHRRARYVSLIRQSGAPSAMRGWA